MTMKFSGLWPETEPLKETPKFCSEPRRLCLECYKKGVKTVVPNEEFRKSKKNLCQPCLLKSASQYQQAPLKTD